MIIPHIPDDNINHISFIGESEDRPLCKYCKTTRLLKNGRMFWCRTCNNRFDFGTGEEQIREDLGVCALNIKPSLVCMDKERLTKRAVNDSREEISKKYGKRVSVIDDTQSLLRRAGVRIINEWEIGL